MNNRFVLGAWCAAMVVSVAGSAFGVPGSALAQESGVSTPPATSVNGGGNGDRRARLEAMSPEERRALVEQRRANGGGGNGDRRARLEAMSPEERRAFVEQRRSNGGGGNGDRRARLEAMSPEDRRAFVEQRRANGGGRNRTMR